MSFPFTHLALLGLFLSHAATSDSMLLACLTDSGCSCCSMAAVSFSLASLIDLCTDIDTDAKEAALQPTANAWPLPIRESIWKDRLTFRQLLKQQTRTLNSQLAATATQPLDPTQLTADTLIAAYHYTVHDLHIALRRYPFSPPYIHLLHALLTQLLHSEQAGLEAGEEGETRAERLFAYCLYYDDQAAEARVDDDYFQLQEAGWHERLHETLKGKLLPRRPKRAEDEADSEVTGGAEGGSTVQSATVQSFRSDRRLLRVFVFRLGLERLMEAHIKLQSSQQQSSNTKVS